MRMEPFSRAHDVEGAGLRDYLPIAGEADVGPIRGNSAAARWFLAGLVLGIVCTLYSVTLVGAEPCVSVRVTNGAGRTVHFAPAPATLFADVRVQPRSEHALLVLTWDDPDVFGATGSSRTVLHGDREPILHQRKMTDLAGDYEVIARVYRDASGRRVCGSASTTVHVGGGPA